MTLKEIKPTDPDYHKPIEELIDDLGHAEPANQHGDVIITVEDLTDALHYLQTYQKIEDEYEELKDWWAEEYVTNEPLSWEQLKQMQGKPVWIEDGLENGEWYIIECFTESGRFIAHDRYADDTVFKAIDIGNMWQAYRKERQNVQS